MRVEDLIVFGKEQIHSDFAKMLLADLLGMNTLELYNHLDLEVSESIKQEYQKRLDLLNQKKPIQYVMGNVNFYGLPFFINENVLIPRFETEELVENTLKIIQKKFQQEDLRIIDLGCGSGVIGLTLKHFLPDAQVTLLDISDEALKVASKNAENLQLDVEIIKGDMLECVDEKFHIIISNPPYIEDEEKIEDSVRDNEPHLALYGGKDGLNYYRKILENCQKNLFSNFLIAFEIGYQQKERITQLAYHHLKNVTVTGKKDLSGRDRMIFIESK